MALSKCARCKKIFAKIASPVCPKCQPEEDADFTKIHHTLAKFPGAKAEEIALHAGVKVDCVMRMLNEGRLRYADTGEKALCGRCGAPAISMAKRLCEKCLMELDRECAEAMRDLQKGFFRGPRPKKGRGSAGVLGEMRDELEQTRTSETLKRTHELEERAHPSKSKMVAREAREKKRGGKK